VLLRRYNSPVLIPIQLALIFLQAFQLLFLLVHDWLPLGRLNDVAAFRRTSTPREMLLALLVPSIPVATAFALSLVYVRSPFPLWLRTWLCITYGLLFLGELESWWIPYAFGASPSRVERYQSLFSRTHSFLPSRHGIVPNTLHVILHAFTLSTVILALPYRFAPFY
jgi:hypothetical protein